jgi:hypothetical protein
MELGFSMPALLQPALVEAMIHVNVSFLWLTARKRVFLYFTRAAASVSLGEMMFPVAHSSMAALQAWEKVRRDEEDSFVLENV